MKKILLAIQKFLIKQRQPITVGFLLIEIGLVLWWIWIYWQAALDYPSVVWILFEFGPKFGILAAMLYVLTLIPGIIGRFQWRSAYIQPITSSITLFRRHIGILMFIIAFLHLTFSSTLPYLALYNFQPPGLPSLRQFEIMGAIGWLILFPLWLTSNDWAVHKMGKWWKRLHRLTYLALFFIFLHVALRGEAWAVILGLALILEFVSWILFWIRKFKS